MGNERKYEGVRAASASSIEIDFYYAGKRRKEYVKLEPTPANLRRAFNHRAAILKEIESGTFDYLAVFPNSKQAKQYVGEKQVSAAGLTLATYLGTWLDEMEKRVKSSTWDDYRKIVNNTIIPKIGSTLLVDMSVAKAKSLVKDMECSNKRIGNILSVLRSALDEAVIDEYIEVNPIADWTYQNVEAPKKVSDVDPFTKEEQALILEACTGQYHNLVKFAFWTGLRTSELVALDWSDIDWVRGVIHVTRAMTQCSDDPEDTKTDAGRREVKLLAPAMEALLDQRKYTFEKDQEIFQNPRTLGRWSGDQTLRKGYWIPAVEKAGVRYRRQYQTRHTYASMMLSAGEHPMWVAKQMGHSDWTMIGRIYGKWMPDAAPDAGNKAEALFGTNLAVPTVSGEN